MRALVVGGTAGVGRALCEELAKQGYELLIVASDARDLDAQVAHLRLVYGVRAEAVAVDAGVPDACLEPIYSAGRAFGALDAMFFPIGTSRNDDQGTLAFNEAQRLANINLLFVIGVVSRFLPGMLRSNTGCIVGFGSIAAIRGRGNNIIYAACKRALESYFESLQHLLAKSGVGVHFYKLGYVATQQSFGRHLLFPPASPQSIAKKIVRAMGHKRCITYLPGYWTIIARIVSALPWMLFKRLNF